MASTALRGRSGTSARRGSGLLRQETREGWLFAMPFIAGFVIWTVVPMAVSAWLSFTQWDIVTPSKWVGLSNYSRLIGRDQLFYKSLGNTLYLTFGGIAVSITASLAAAFALNIKTRLTNTYRLLFFMPSQIPAVANAVLWALMFNYEFGIVNLALRAVGLQPLNWLYNVTTVKPALVFMGLWGIGGTIIIFLAGLQGIPEALYEAAQIDGAGIWQRLRRITMPLLTPVIFFNLIMGVIGGLQGGFTTVYVMTGGGPANSTLVTMLYLYQQAFSYMHMGYASAFAWIIFAIIMVFTFLQFRLSRLWVFYETR